jgi:hypothetical protein
MSQDDLEPLPPDLQRLLRQGRPGAEPPPGSSDAVLKFIALEVGALGAAALVHGVAGSTHAASAAGRGALGRALLALKGSVGIGGLVVGAAVGTGVGAAGHAALVSRHAEPPPPTTATVAARSAATSASYAVPAAPSATAPAPPIVTAVSPTRAVSPPPEATAARRADAPSSAKDTALRSEGALIDMARTAVARGQGDVALATLERHGRDFPNGRLAEDREWLWIQALLMTGRTDEAKARASRFRSTFPRSMYLPALDQVLPSE